MQILWLEDDPDFRRQMEHLVHASLSDADASTVVGVDSVSARGEVLTTNFDALLIDVELSGHSDRQSDQHAGLDLIRQLRSSSPGTRILAYTRYWDPAQDLRLREEVQAADLFISGPLGKAAYESQVSDVLGAFLPAKKERDVDTALVKPVRESIVAVNRRLAERFRDNPELVRKLDPFIFEELVAELFEHDGYEVVLTPKRGDGGKDLYVYKSDDKLGTAFVVECKRYLPPRKVGVQIARQLLGVVQHERVSGGVIVTTSYFTRDADEFARTLPYQLFLRDFDDLQLWLTKCGTGSS